MSKSTMKKLERDMEYAVGPADADVMSELEERFRLASLIERCVYVINIDAAKKKSRIVFTPPAEIVVAQVDPAKIKQVIDNLLTHAVKYSPPGSVIRVHLLPPTDAAGPALGVIDQGPGIPESERDKLFRDFGRLSVKPTGGEKSTGLGLAICRKIVDAHGATIVAENQPAGGCEFRVTLAKAA